MVFDLRCVSFGCFTKRDNHWYNQNLQDLGFEHTYSATSSYRQMGKGLYKFMDFWVTLMSEKVVPPREEFRGCQLNDQLRFLELRNIYVAPSSKNHQKLEGQYLVFAARFAAMTTFRPWEIYPATSLDSKVAKCQVMVTDRLFFVMGCQNLPKPSHFTFHFYPSAIEHGLMEQLPFSSMIFPIFPINYPPCSY